jgi:hypothetical protein
MSEPAADFTGQISQRVSPLDRDLYVEADPSAGELRLCLG